MIGDALGVVVGLLVLMYAAALLHAVLKLKEKWNGRHRQAAETLQGGALAGDSAADEGAGADAAARTGAFDLAGYLARYSARIAADRARRAGTGGVMGKVPRGTGLAAGVAGPGPCARCGTPIAVQAGGMMCGPCAAWVAPPPRCTLCGASDSSSAPLGPGGFCPACYLQVTGGMGQVAVGQGVAMTATSGRAVQSCCSCRRGVPATVLVAGMPLCGSCATAHGAQFTITSGNTANPLAEPLPRDDLRLVDLIGWRIWRVTGSGYLRSLTAEVIWLPGEPMEAAEVTDHGAASNGIHVFMHKAAALKEMTIYLRHEPHFSYALGSVLLWGDVVEHERGYRAERAKILSIDDVVWEGKPPWDAETKRALAFLRERYGVAG